MSSKKVQSIVDLAKKQGVKAEDYPKVVHGTPYAKIPVRESKENETDYTSTDYDFKKVQSIVDLAKKQGVKAEDYPKVVSQTLDNTVDVWKPHDTAADDLYVKKTDEPQEQMYFREPVKGAASVSAQDVLKGTAPTEVLLTRGIQLAGITSRALTDSEKQEAGTIRKALEKEAGELRGGFWAAGSAEDKRKANNYSAIAAILNNKISVGAAFMGGVIDAIPFAGRGFDMVQENAEKLISENDAFGYTDEVSNVLSGNRAMSDLQTANPTAHAIGSGAMNLGLLLGTSGAISTATGGIKWFSKLSPWVKSAINSGLSFGTVRGLHAADDVQTKKQWDEAQAKQAEAAAAIGVDYKPQEYSAWGQVENVLKEFGIGLAGGAVGGTASSLVGDLVKGILVKYSLQTPFAEAIRQTVSGTAFAAANTGTTYFMYPEGYRPSKEQIVQDLAVAFLFSAVVSSVSAYQSTKANKAYIENAVSEMQKEYEKTFNGNRTAAERQAAYDHVLEYNQLIRKAISQNYYAGGQSHINEVLSGLNALDEQIMLVKQNTGFGTGTPLIGNIGAVQTPPGTAPDIVSILADTGTHGAPTSGSPVRIGMAGTAISKAASTGEPDSSAKTDANEVVNKIKANIPALEGEPIVTALDRTGFKKSSANLTEQAGAFFKSMGTSVFRNGFGNVTLDEQGILPDITRGIDRTKAITFASIPDVIANGTQIDFQPNWKGQGKDSYIFAAPVDVDGKKAYVGAVVLKDRNNRFYLNEVVDNDGNIIFSKADASETIRAEVAIQDGITSNSEAPNNIFQGYKKSNSEIEQLNRLSETLGTAGRQVLTEFYNQDMPATEYFKEFVKIYNGAQDRNFSGEITSGVLNLAQQKAAAIAGRADMESASKAERVATLPKSGYTKTKENMESEGMNYVGGEEARRGTLRQGRARDVPQRESGGHGSVSAGTAAVRAGWEFSGVPKDSERESLRYEKEINPESFLPEAKKGQKVYRDASGTESVRTSHALAEKNGLKVEAWGGGEIEIENGGSIRAFAIPGTDRIGIQTDNPEVAGDDLARHEIMEQKLLRGEITVDEVLTGAEQYVDAAKIQAAVEFYYNGYPSKGIEHARSELVCDGADHINQLSYDVQHGNLGGGFAELADMLDEVIWAINRTANELTDGAFELDGAPAYSKKIKESGNGQEAGASGGRAGNSKGYAEISDGTGHAGDAGRGSRTGGAEVGESQIRYADRSQGERDKLSEILITPIDNDPEWRDLTRKFTVDKATLYLCNRIDEKSPIISEWEKFVPGFKEAVAQARAYAGRTDIGRNAGAKAGAVSVPMHDSKGRVLSEDQRRYFAESAVRDGDGNLLTLYHGSRYGTFDEFDLYEGVWLTPDREYAKIYGEHIHELYANIKNPLELGEVDAALTPEKVRELAGKMGATVKELKEISERYMQEDIYSLTRSHEFIELAAKYHFDGLAATENGHRTYCAIDEQNQVKQTGNLTPSEKPSTRFSMKTPVEKKDGLIALHNLTADKLDGALRLGGFPMPSIAVTRAGIPHTNFGDITLVMDKSTIDPKANRKNTVYSADAWTPTFPRIEYEIDKSVEHRAIKTLDELTSGLDSYYQGRVQSFAEDMERTLSNYGGFDGMVEQAMRDKGMKAAYLTNKGLPIDDEQINKAITDKVDFEAWVRGLFDGLVKDTGIYNNKDIFTPSGNRKSFKQTHYPVTLDNMAKAMAAQNGGDTRNVSGFYGVKSLRAGTAKRFSSIKEMHEYEGRLQHLTEEQAEEINEAFSARLTDLMQHIYDTKTHGKYDNPFIEMDAIGNILTEASEKPGKTIDSIGKVFSQYGYTLDNEILAEIRDLLFDISQMPVNIFEAKPERSVHFDEVLAAIVPESTDKNLLESLRLSGVQDVRTYPDGDNEARMRLANDVGGAKFSSENENLKELREENKVLREKVEKWKGQTKRTQRQSLRQSDIDKLAHTILKEYESELKVADINENLKGLGEYIVNGGDGKNELTYSEVKDRAVAIAWDVLDNARVLVSDGDAETYSSIRAYFRGTPLAYKDSGDIADYNDFRRRNFGRFIISKNGLPIDVAYKELTSMYGESYFPPDITHPSDQLVHIAELFDEMQPIFENPHSFYMAEAVEYCANEIIDELISEGVRQVPPTFADRQASKLDIQKIEDRRKLDALREQKNARIEEIKSQGRERAKAAVSQEKAKRTEQIAALREHYAKVRADKAARAADSKARTRLLNIAKRLQNKKLPAVSRALLNGYIGELDTVSRKITGKTVEKLADLRAWYEERCDNDPDFISDPYIEKKLARLSQKQIGDLSAGEVAELTDVLLNIENELLTQRKLIDEADGRDTYHMGVQVINDIGNAAGVTGDGLKNLLDKYIVTETLSPLRQIRRVTGYMDDDPLYRLTQSLADGQRKSFDYQMRAEKSFRSFTGDKAFTSAFSGRHAEEIKITGMCANGPKTVSISPAMRVSLYLHSLNDANLRHIARGGVTVPDWELYKAGKIAEAYARSETIRLTPSEVRRITLKMTDKERAFALAAKKYFNTQSRDEINAVSEKLKGYPIAQVDNYYPINTDGSFTTKQFEAIKFDGSIESQGWTKERENASNPIYLRDANDVTLRAIRQHGDYVGLAIPIRNFNKVWGVTKRSFDERGKRNGYESSAQKALKNKWGDAAYGYVEKMMADLSPGRSDLDVWGKALSRVRGNYAKAVLTLNMSVAMKQAASYPTAAEVLGWRPLNRAMLDMGKVDLDLIAKYTPLQWYRSKGFSTQELGDLQSRDKSLPKLLNWVQGVDLLTTRKLWKASEYYIRQHEKSLSVGSEGYYRAVAEIYDRVIEETQPNYTTMQRPQLLRSDNQLMQSLAMFKTQPFQNFNILYDAAGNMLAKGRQLQALQTLRGKGAAEKIAGAEAAYKSAKNSFGRAVTSQLAQMAVFAGMTLLWNALRGKWDKYKDSDGEPDLASVFKGVGKDMLAGAFGSVPWGSDIYELSSSMIWGDAYYGVEAVVPSAINDMFGEIKSFADAIGNLWEGDGETEPDWVGHAHELDKLATAVSKVLGIPYENVTNLYAIVFKKAARALVGETLGAYYTLRATEDMSKTYIQQEAYDILYQAYKTRDDDYETLYDAMLSDGFDADKIKNNIEKRAKNEQGVESVKELEGRYLSPDQQDIYDEMESTVKASRLWGEADEELRSKTEDILYGLATGAKNSVVSSVRNKAAEGASTGVSETDIVLLTIALEMYDANKNGHYDKAETQAAIDAISGLSQEERAYMFSIANKSKYNPYE